MQDATHLADITTAPGIPEGLFEFVSVEYPAAPPNSLCRARNVNPNLALNLEILRYEPIAVLANDRAAGSSNGPQQ
jgi:hypothetical protein